MTEPMSLAELDEIRTRAAHLAESEALYGELDVLATANVPQLLDEVDRLRAQAHRLRLASSPEFARTLGRTERERDEARADRDALAEQLARVRALFDDGGPDTPCRTTWRHVCGDHMISGVPPAECVPVECVEVPTVDLRAALDGES